MNITKKTLGITALVCLLVGAILGFVPEYNSKSHLEEKNFALTDQGEARQKTLRHTENELTLNEFALQAAVLSGDANSNNYSDASQNASKLFTALRTYEDSTNDSAAKQTLSDVLAMRDSVIAGLAKADPGVRAELGQIFSKLRTLSTESGK
jgi:hypothetical protein